MSKEYIVNITGVVIHEDEWDNTHIQISRNGICDELEFDKTDIVETREVNDE
tara:strand:+ start:592 stop:747 length:156 start_codon:yes stop_codon:yes gene_type:complete